VISTQHGAVCKSGKGDEPIDVKVPSLPSLNAETVPLRAPPWAFETKSCVARAELAPERTGPCASNGDPDAAVSRPSAATTKPSITDVPIRAPTSFVPSPLTARRRVSSRPAATPSSPRSYAGGHPG
jgi:hypothetical protein